eukprot:TRINITY_DN2287_c0_g1_i1.p1 TRINITY_DN2287_c0_g1~~TRINITY_DN2287_c0_g1_i1.p1  ORF type:complete len:151 (-),score=45.40 TRINITY_DN2287_c0_g1_i1:84-536(-)
MNKQIVAILLLGLIAVTLAGNCGGNCPGGRCTTCPCGSNRNNLDIDAWCAKWPGVNVACCKCIAQHESGGNGNAMNGNSNGSIDVGLWQVNSINWGQCNGGAAPCDPDANLRCAQKVWQWGGRTFKLWSTCGACGCCNRGMNTTMDALSN